MITLSDSPVKGSLFILMGLPRSGKSTIAKQWQNYELDIEEGKLLSPIVDLPSKPRVVVCGDWIRKAFTGKRYIHDTEEYTFLLCKLFIRCYLDNGYDILFDDTNSSEFSLSNLAKIDSNFDWYCIFPDRDICKERAISCGHHDLVEQGVIDRVYMNLFNLFLKHGSIKKAIVAIKCQIERNNNVKR